MKKMSNESHCHDAVKTISPAVGHRYFLVALVILPVVMGIGGDAKSATVNEVAKQVAEFTLQSAFDREHSTVCAYFALLQYARAIHSKEILDRVIASYKPFLDGKQSPASGHVDANVFGIVPFELYNQTGNDAYLVSAQMMADNEFSGSQADGLSPYTRYWVDDMFMIGALQAQAFTALKLPVYYDRGATQLAVYVAKLQQPNGLFHHTPSAKFFWARGNAWAALGLVDVINILPSDHSQYKLLMSAYCNLMKALVQNQDKSGMWRQLLDKPDAWLESSGTGMFIAALATGLQHHWIEGEAYRTAVDKGWRALQTFIDKDGKVREVSDGVQQGSTESYYLERQRLTGASHGETGVLLAATALLTLESSQPEKKANP